MQQVTVNNCRNETGREATLLSFELIEHLLLVAIKPIEASLENERQEGANKKGMNLNASEHVECCFNYILSFHSLLQTYMKNFITTPKK